MNELKETQDANKTKDTKDSKEIKESSNETKVRTNEASKVIKSSDQLSIYFEEMMPFKKTEYLDQGVSQQNYKVNIVE